MKKYLEKNLGKVIRKEIVTGNEFYTEVYKRVYLIEILRVNDDNLLVEVNSKDVTPTGYFKRGRDKYYGELEVVIGNKTRLEIMNEIVKKCDNDFLVKYNIKIA